jgi:hypothetical protein
MNATGKDAMGARRAPLLDFFEEVNASKGSIGCGGRSQEEEIIF